MRSDDGSRITVKVLQYSSWDWIRQVAANNNGNQLHGRRLRLGQWERPLYIVSVTTPALNVLNKSLLGPSGFKNISIGDAVDNDAFPCSSCLSCVGLVAYGVQVLT